MRNLGIHFFFTSILFIIHVWEDKSKPSNIHNIIMLFTVLHAVAKQPIKIAKKLLSALIFVVSMVTRNGFLMLFLTVNVPIASKVIYFSPLLKCLRSLYGKQCGPRSGCFYT